MAEIVVKDIHASEIKAGGISGSNIEAIDVLSSTGSAIIKLMNNADNARIFLYNNAGADIVGINSAGYIYFQPPANFPVVVGSSTGDTTGTVFQVKSTDRAMTIPRLTTAQVTTLSGTLIAGGLSGAILFNTDTGKLMVMDKTGFVAVH